MADVTICPNPECGVTLRHTTNKVAGPNGYTVGTTDEWDVICPSCHAGHQYRDRDDVPGMKNTFVGKCCNCGSRDAAAG
jgi:hypothetical protein